jgi:hypothetical protein
MDRQEIVACLEEESAEEVFAILEKYYPRRRIKPATQFFVEEIFG